MSWQQRGVLLACRRLAFQHAKVCGHASQRAAVPGGLRAALHVETKSCAAGWPLSTSLCFFHKRNSAHDAFSLPQQESCHFLRQREGLRVHSVAAKRGHVVVNTTERLIIKPTEEEKWLASQLKVAGDSKEGHWQKLFDEYSGSSPIVLNAAMHAALKKRDYEEGLKIYKRVRHMTLPTYTISMKLLGKLGQHDEVERRWRQLVEYDLVDQPAAGGRIDAAADNGDIQAAVRVLDYMKEKCIEATTLHFSSAINACANSQDSNRAKAAQGFFDEMLRTGLKPNIVTYANVLRAFRQEPRQRLLNLLVHMKEQHVEANVVFAEAFLFIFLRSPHKGGWTNVDVIASHLRKLSQADLEAAQDFIDELKGTKVELNKSCRLIAAAVRLVLQEARSAAGRRR